VAEAVPPELIWRIFEVSGVAGEAVAGLTILPKTSGVRMTIDSLVFLQNL